MLRATGRADDAPSSFLKWAWAYHHLGTLQKLAERFENSQPAEIVTKFKPKRPGYDRIFQVTKPTPEPIPLIAGDVIGCLRDALDHLIYELSVAYSGAVPLDIKVAFPICERRSQWLMQPGGTGRVNTRSGEWKTQLIDPRAQARVRSLQPFYRKQRDGPHRKHSLWMLDELRNIDRHRRLSLTPLVGMDAQTRFERKTSVTVLRTYTRRVSPKNGAVVERVWLNPGAVESDVRVSSVVTSKMAFDEPGAYLRITGLIPGLFEAARIVQDVLVRFAEFQPEAVQKYLETKRVVQL